jgi:drug/metabolite transporter (DMT)-like permease
MTPIPGTLVSLSSALVWGSADFFGGLAARKQHVFQVLTLSSFSGICLLILCLVGQTETHLSLSSLLWAAASGISGAIGLAFFYSGLSLGNTIIVAPTAAVIGAVLPVAFASFSEGLPKFFQFIGFVLAFLGIWFVSQSSFSGEGSSNTGFWIAVLAGLFFGGFFVFISRVESGQVFMPLLISRSFELLVALFILLVRKLPMPSLGSNKLALLTGLLDSGGSILFVYAKYLTRLDMAVVLSSLYPVVTVCLAFLLLKEKVSFSQWIGVALCFSSVVLITI